MFIRSVVATLAVCAGVCVQATPMFTPGDVYWISRKSMGLFEVKAGNCAGSAALAAFPGTWDSVGGMVISEDLMYGYAAVSSVNASSGNIVRFTADGQYTMSGAFPSPTAIAELNNKIYFTSGTGLYRLEPDGRGVLIASGLATPKTLIAYDGYLLVAEPTSNRIRKITINGSTGTVSNLYSGLTGPVDMVVYGNTLYYSSQTSSSPFASKIMKIDLTTGVRSEHATGRTFYGLTVAGDRLLAADFGVATGGIWDVTAGGNYSSTSAWVWDLPGPPSIMLAAAPGMPPVDDPPPPEPVPESSTLLLIALGGGLMSIKRVCA